MKEVMKQMYRGKLTPYEAVLAIDTSLGGLTAVHYGKGLTLETQTKRHSMKVQGLRKKDLTKVQEFATLGYDYAQRQGSIFPGEVHLGKKMSTKHHTSGFRQYLDGLRSKYCAA
jgi:hypothetical protein